MAGRGRGKGRGRLREVWVTRQCVVVVFVCACMFNLVPVHSLSIDIVSVIE